LDFDINKEIAAWLFDCDDAETLTAVRSTLMYKVTEVYEYKTKNGSHILVPPFNRDCLGTFNENGLMLWAYTA
jgi:hypothetical protein